MPVLTAPPPDVPRPCYGSRDASDFGSAEWTEIRDIVANAFALKPVEESIRTTTQRERENRWVCEWWPPD